MSDEQKKTNESEETSNVSEENTTEENNNTAEEAKPEVAKTEAAKPAGGGLPGLGGAAKPAGGGLPGLGGGGGLPGLGGAAKPAGGGLPGLGGGGGLPGLGGAAKPAGGGLPGLGGGGGGLPGAASAAPAPGGVVPDFIKKKQEEERLAAVARDPFASGNLPEQRASFVPHDVGEIPQDTGPPIEGSSLGGNKRGLIIVIGVLALIFFGVGYGAGSAVSQRGVLNRLIRDARIIKYEMEKLRDIHGDVSSMITNALGEAGRKKFNKVHAGFLLQKVNGNPFDARIFTDRNYKSLNPMVVQMMSELYRDWAKLAILIAEHDAHVTADKKMLETAKDELKKVLTTNYGVIFSRNEQAGNQLVANIVILGASEDGRVKIQTRTGGYSSDRELYNPEGADDKLTENPGEYVILVDDQSKKTILLNASQSHFNAYTERLMEMNKLVKQMEEKQGNMFTPLNDNCSREPVSFLANGVDTKAEFDDYVKKAEAKAAAE